jgi:hypothetical protein
VYAQGTNTSCTLPLMKRISRRPKLFLITGIISTGAIALASLLRIAQLCGLVRFGQHQASGGHLFAAAGG